MFKLTFGGRWQMARRTVAQRRRMPDRKVWPGRGWPPAKTSTCEGPGNGGALIAMRRPCGTKLSP